MSDEFIEDEFLEESEPNIYGIAIVDKFASLSDSELKKAADNGNEEAQVAYGVRRHHSYEAKDHLEEAFRYFKMTADSGCPEGKYVLGHA